LGHHPQSRRRWARLKRKRSGRERCEVSKRGKRESYCNVVNRDKNPILCMMRLFRKSKRAFLH